MNEFTLIERFFAKPRDDRADAPPVKLGIGDDCAVLAANDQEDWLFTTDTLIEGRHFLPQQDPKTLAARLLAVNASDIAAMGGEAKWCLLSLTLPEANARWLKAFSRAFHQGCAHMNVALIGGNTTRGALAIGLTLIGVVPKSQAILRNGAQVGDDVWVSGTPGLAALGLAILQDRQTINPKSPLARAAKHAYHCPAPPLSLAPALRGIAHAMIDISDGVLQDATHLAHAAKVRIHLHTDRLPEPKGWAKASGDNTPAWQRLAMTGGDDYQLLFTAAPQHRRTLHSLASTHQVTLTPIGEVLAPHKTGKVQCMNQGHPLHFPTAGFQHF